MRLAVAGCVALLSALAVPLAASQVGSSSLDVRVQVPEAQEAGNETVVVFTVFRHCGSAASILPEQVVEVAVQPLDGNATATGPGQVVFAQQVCATQAMQSADVAYGVRTPRDAADGDVHHFIASFQPQAGSTPSVAGPGQEASIGFTVGVAGNGSAAQAAAGMDGPEELDAPALPAILLALALVGAAFALRRRA